MVIFVFGACGAFVCSAERKSGKQCPALKSGSNGRGTKFTPVQPCHPHLASYCFANISLIMSLSTSVVRDALSGIAGLHLPLTTGFILNGMLMLGGTSLPSFFIIAAVKAKRAWSFWPL